ncbi:DUF6542 domain-containing protein [Williamsia sterculiae]|uniref:DUF6542 domain-containing protein n=1 Tax=Williamsia sterculiae TaxID=1344003 RepID=UPI00117ED45C|nr:DUF6542 domain-containing protein [Williamsia sterculiae]
MRSAQRSGPGVSRDQQSVLPAYRGVPWWGAVLIAVVPSAVGAAIDAPSGSLGATFKVLYFLGCVAAVLAVRRRALFTAAAQPPLLLFGIALIALYAANAGTTEGVKGLIINVLLPIAKLFPLMGWTFVLVVALAGARWFTTRPTGGATATRSRATSRAGTGRTTPRRSASDRQGAERTTATQARRGERVRANGRASSDERARTTEQRDRVERRGADGRTTAPARRDPQPTGRPSRGAPPARRATSTGTPDDSPTTVLATEPSDPRRAAPPRARRARGERPIDEPREQPRRRRAAPPVDDHDDLWVQPASRRPHRREP